MKKRLLVWFMFLAIMFEGCVIGYQGSVIDQQSELIWLLWLDLHPIVRTK